MSVKVPRFSSPMRLQTAAIGILTALLIGAIVCVMCLDGTDAGDSWAREGMRIEEDAARLFEVGDFTSAANRYEDLIAHCGGLISVAQDARDLGRLGRCLDLAGRASEARECFRKALEMHSSSEIRSYWMFSIAAESDPESAVDWLRRQAITQEQALETEAMFWTLIGERRKGALRK